MRPEMVRSGSRSLVFEFGGSLRGSGNLRELRHGAVVLGLEAWVLLSLGG